ncbi:hypothetical protein GGI42DRAFT_337091 [Trichoderma sp. SZMC 28013]
MATSPLDSDQPLCSPLSKYDNIPQEPWSNSVGYNNNLNEAEQANLISEPYILVHGLSARMDIHALRHQFEKYGVVTSCKIQVPNFYGYVNMSSIDNAREAVMGLNGVYLKEYKCALQLRQAGPPPARELYPQANHSEYFSNRVRNGPRIYNDRAPSRWYTPKSHYYHVNNYARPKTIRYNRDYHYKY